MRTPLMRAEAAPPAENLFSQSTEDKLRRSPMYGVSNTQRTTPRPSTTPENQQAAQQGTASTHPSASREKVGGCDVSFKDGHLQVKGGKGNDDIKLERDGVNLKLTVNGQTRTYENVKSADLRGGKGDDKIDVASDLGLERLHIDGGKGKDTIRNRATPTDELDCGAVNPFAQFKNGRTTIRGGKGDDDIVTDAQRAEIYGGRGDDKITAHGDNVIAHGGRGRDTIQVTGNNAEVHGGRGQDTIQVTGDHAHVGGGRGDDTITVKGDAARVRGRRGDDTIHVEGNNAEVRGGRGQDTIRVEGNNADVRGGRGEDTIEVKGDNARIRLGLRDKLKVDGQNAAIEGARHAGAHQGPVAAPH